MLQPVWWMAVAVACAVAGGGCLLAGRGWSRRVSVVAVLLSAVAVGGTLESLSDPGNDAADWAQQCPRQTTMRVRLVEQPQPRQRSYRVGAVVEQRDGVARRGGLVLYVHRDSLAARLRYGDRLLVDCRPDTERRTAYVAEGRHSILSRDSTSLRARSEAVRRALVVRMRRGPLDERYVGVVEALTLGWRADVGEELRQQFRDAGLAHLLAVSGLHVGLVAALAGALLGWLGRERRGRVLRGALQLVAVWLFALLTGMAPSTVRAALMFSLFIVSDVLARRTESLNTLAAAAIIMLLADPQLLFDVGWQLSFSAVAGILLAMPAIHAMRTVIGRAAAVSMAATVATLPIIVAVFGRLPFYSLVANVLLVPATGVLMVLALAYVAVPCDFTAWPAGALLWLVDRLTAWLSRLPGAVVEGFAVSGLGVLAIAAVSLAVVLLPRFVQGRG